jgi:hypothetical protein
MRQLFFLLIWITLWSGIPARASAYFSLEEEADSSGLKDQHISFAWENDLYYQHDYYFTNGFQIDFFHDWLRRSPINRILLPTGKKVVGKRYSGLQLRQEIFTPKDLASDTISAGDHPYSSTLTLAQVSVFLMPDTKIRIVSALRLGVLGPASLGYRTQELAHQVSNPSRPPQGWEYQLRNDLLINYDIQMEKGILDKGFASFGIRGKSRLGTLHTDLEAGLWMILDARKSYFNRFGPSGDPGLHVLLRLFAGGRRIFYDATLQGGVFNKSNPYVLTSGNLIRWIGNLEASLLLEVWQHQLEIYSQLASPRFLYGESHGWVGIAYRYWF